MMIFVNHVKSKDEESIKTTIMNTAERIEGDIDRDIFDLRWCALLMVVFYGF